MSCVCIVDQELKVEKDFCCTYLPTSVCGCVCRLTDVFQRYFPACEDNFGTPMWRWFASETLFMIKWSMATVRVECLHGSNFSLVWKRDTLQGIPTLPGFTACLVLRTVKLNLTTPETTQVVAVRSMITDWHKHVLYGQVCDAKPHVFFHSNFTVNAF